MGVDKSGKAPKGIGITPLEPSYHQLPVTKPGHPASPYGQWLIKLIQESFLGLEINRRDYSNAANSVKQIFAALYGPHPGASVPCFLFPSVFRSQAEATLGT